MQKEILIFLGVVAVSLFMTIHNHNKLTMNNNEIQLLEQRASQESMLIEDGNLIKLNSGVTLSKSADLIIIKQARSTIVLNGNDAKEVIAFLEK
jgi:hypothetical protein|tara:strand:- start:39 stop:320 length:282 start_codon:yes stop_codon:yes gene_type:complete